MNFNLGNAVKYVWRAGKKGDRLEDLKKAAWYLNREIQRLEGEQIDRAVEVLEKQANEPAPKPPTNGSTFYFDSAKGTMEFNGHETLLNPASARSISFAFKQYAELCESFKDSYWNRPHGVEFDEMEAYHDGRVTIKQSMAGAVLFGDTTKVYHSPRCWAGKLEESKFSLSVPDGLMLSGGLLYKLNDIEAESLSLALKVYARELKKREVANIFRTAKEEQQREETIFKKTCEEALEAKKARTVGIYPVPIQTGPLNPNWIGPNQKRENEGKQPEA
jgi:hypothetical protein